MRTLLRFRTAMFQSTYSRPDMPARAAYGEDLAGWLRARLQAEGWVLPPPRWSDGAWRLECSGPGGEHRLQVRRLAEEEWSVGLERTRSWLAERLLSAPAPDVMLVDAVFSAFAREPAVREVRWDSERAAALAAR